MSIARYSLTYYRRLSYGGGSYPFRCLGRTPLPVDPPGSAALDRISRYYGLALSDADVASFEPAVGGLLSSWDAVERLYAGTAPTAAHRAWTRPAEAGNPLGACNVTASI